MVDGVPLAVNGVPYRLVRRAVRETQGLFKAGRADRAISDGQARGVRLVPQPVRTKPNAPVNYAQDVGLDCSEPPKLPGLQPDGVS